MIGCSGCGAELRPGTGFCAQCGLQVGASCAACGTALEPADRFCGACGSPVAGQPVAPRSAPVAEAAGEPGGPELRLVSVLFVDLVGFTSLSESREAEDVRELLSRYYETARTIVGRYGGSIEKFIGDAVMAVWGSPVAREDDAERSVRAALELVDAVAAFGESVGAPEVRARAGVVTGRAASVADPDEGLVVGDRVNTAARVQSAAEPGSVFVDEVTRGAAAAAILFADAGEHAVKGKSEPLALWRAVRVVAGTGGSEREQVLEAPFVGRDRELRLLKELFHGAVDRGAARLVAVSGPAGVGKSRLRWEFSKYTDGLADTFLWHTGRCLSYGDGIAYWALSEMVRQRLGIPEDAPAADADAKLEAGLERWVTDPDERAFIAPRLGALLGVAEPGLEREELFAGWRLFFERLAGHEPVVLVFEDLHWADPGLLDFIEQLLEWSARARIFVLAFARPEFAARPDGWPRSGRGVMQLDLEPLADEAIGALLDGLVDGLPGAARARIVERAEGVPLYAVETVRALTDRGAIVQRGDRLVTVGEVGELDVPASLGSLLAARLDALAPAERGLVKAMSAFGGSFPRDAAAALTEIADGELDGVLAGLVRKQVLAIRTDPLSPDRGQYQFAQGLLRTVAYGMLSRAERKQRHLAAAEHLRAVFPDEGEDVAEAIASHYLDAHRAAGEDLDAEQLRADALLALRRAARRGAAVGAPEIGERNYLTAVALSAEERERAELTAGAGAMALQAGRYERALELLEQAQSAHRAADRESDGAGIAADICWALTRIGRVEEAAARAQAALAQLDAAGGTDADAEVGKLREILGRALVFAGEYERAAAALEAALALAEARELPDVVSQALCDKGLMYAQTGRPHEARLLYAGAVETAERHELNFERYRALTNLGNHALQWDAPDAAADIEAALAVARSRGDRFAESLDAGNLMAVWLLAGRWEEAQRLGAELLDADPDRPGAEYVHGRLTLLATLRGDHAAVRAQLERLAAWERHGDIELGALRAGVAVAVLLAEDQAERALETGLAYLPAAIETLSPATDGVRDGWPQTLQAALDTARAEQIDAVLALLGERPPGHIPPYLSAHLRRGRALLAALQGDEEAEQGLRSALDAFAKLGYPFWEAVVRVDLACLLADRGAAQEAAQLLAPAVATLERLGAAPALARARTVAAASAAVAG